MTAALADPGWADTAARTPSDREPGTCRVCGKAVCSHPDAVFSGIVPMRPFAPTTGFMPGDGDERRIALSRDNPLRHDHSPAHDGTVTSEAAR